MSKLLVSYWHDQLRAALEREKYLNDEQVQSIMKRFDKAVQTHANPETVFEALLDEFGNTDSHEATAKALNECKASILEDLERINKQTIEVNSLTRLEKLCPTHREEGYYKARERKLKSQYNLPNGLELEGRDTPAPKARTLADLVTEKEAEADKKMSVALGHVNFRGKKIKLSLDISR